MMPITRRTFLQSSLGASLAAAAEVTRCHWLLSSTTPVCIGVVGLDASALEHLSLFAAIPGAKVLGLTDGDPKRIRVALRQLK
jgi:hypothetical protein